MSLLYAPEPTTFNSPAVSCDCLAHVLGSAADHPDRVRRYPSDMTAGAGVAGGPGRFQDFVVTTYRQAPEVAAAEPWSDGTEWPL